MSKILRKTLRFLLFSIAGTAIFASGKMAHASEAPLDIKLSIASGKVMVGQPILVDCQLANASMLHGVSIDSAENAGCQAWFELYDAENHLVLTETPIVPKRPSFAIFVEIASAKTYKKVFVVSHTVMPRTPGKYTLHAHVGFGYHIQPNKNSGEEIDSSVWNVYSTEVKLPLVVVPSDTEQLRKIARRLNAEAKEATSSPSVAVRALVVMPETVAYTWWLDLANTQHLEFLTAAVLIRELKLLGTQRAAMVLATMWRNENSGAVYSSSASALIGLHKTADSATRHYIESVYFECVGKKLIDSEHPIITFLDD